MADVGTLLNNGQKEEAFQVTHQLADAGDVLAIRNLGVMFTYGIGVAPSFDEGFKYFSLAAEAGDAEAMNSVGVGWMIGRGRPIDKEAAAVWFAVAAERGSTQGLRNVDQIKADFTPEQWQTIEARAHRWQPHADQPAAP